MTSASKHSPHRTPTLGLAGQGAGVGEEKRDGVVGAAVPGRGGLAGQAVRVEMTLQESCFPRLQPHLSCDDPATRLKKKTLMSFLALPYPTVMQSFDSVFLSFISQSIPSPGTQDRPCAGAPRLWFCLGATAALGSAGPSG